MDSYKDRKVVHSVIFCKKNNENYVFVLYEDGTGKMIPKERFYDKHGKMNTK